MIVEISARMAAFYASVMSLAVFFLSVSADPDPLQDVCVADLASGISGLNNIISEG